VDEVDGAIGPEGAGAIGAEGAGAIGAEGAGAIGAEDAGVLGAEGAGVLVAGRSLVVACAAAMPPIDRRPARAMAPAVIVRRVVKKDMIVPFGWAGKPAIVCGGSATFQGLLPRLRPPRGPHESPLTNSVVGAAASARIVPRTVPAVVIKGNRYRWGCVDHRWRMSGRGGRRGRSAFDGLGAGSDAQGGNVQRLPRLLGNTKPAKKECEGHPRRGDESDGNPDKSAVRPA
jgi:hypothetical protein